MTFKTKAIVLKTYTWPRNARLYILYTERFGKVKAAASGVQKIKSKVAGHLQHFILTEVMIAQGKKIDRLAQARFVRGFPEINRDFHSLLQGSYVLEILHLLTGEGVADYEIWRSTLEIFEQLNEQSTWTDELDSESFRKKAFLSRLFALQILNHFGYGPELYQCLHCRKELLPEDLSMSVIYSGLVCAVCRPEFSDAAPAPLSAIKIFREAQRLPISELSKILIDDQTTRFCSGYIDQLVSYHTQKPLRTVQFAQPVQNNVSFI